MDLKELVITHQWALFVKMEFIFGNEMNCRPTK